MLNRCMREVDQASLAAISQQLAPREDISQEVGWETRCCKLNWGRCPSPWLPAARGDPGPTAASHDALSL